VLDLAAVVDGLREHAELVADAVAEGGQPERGHRVEEAGREPPQAAVAERGIGLGRGHLLECRGVRARGGGSLALEAECGQRVAERTPDQELHRQVVDAPRLGCAIGRVGGDPALRELFARELGNRVHHVGRRGRGRRGADGAEQVAIDGERGRLGEGKRRRHAQLWQRATSISEPMPVVALRITVKGKGAGCLPSTSPRASTCRARPSRWCWPAGAAAV